MRSAARRTVIGSVVALIVAGTVAAGATASADAVGPVDATSTAATTAATTTTTTATTARTGRAAPVTTTVPLATGGPVMTSDPEAAGAPPTGGPTTAATPPTSPPSTVTIVVLDGVVDLRVRARGRFVAPRRAGARSSASLVLRLHEDRACVGGYLHGVADPTGVALHRGMYRQVGDVVLDLSGALTGPGCVTLPPGLRAEILAAPAAFYLQVTSERYPAGAVRGQLAA